MNISLYIAVGALLASTLSAAPFQSEFDLSYSDGNIEGDEDKVDNQTILLSYKYHFKPIDTTKGAWREAAFLNGSSFAEVAYFDGKLDNDFDNIDTDGFSAHGRWVFSDQNWIAGLGYRKTKFGADLEDEDFGNQEVSIKDLTFEAGKYLGVSTSLILAYKNTDLSTNDSEFGGSIDFDIYTLSLQHYGSITSNIDYSAKVFWTYFDFGGIDEDIADSSGNSYGADFTIFPMPEFGIGITVTQADNSAGAILAEANLGEGDSIGIHADWFITENIAISLTYADQSFDDLDEGFDLDGDTTTLRATFRF